MCGIAGFWQDPDSTAIDLQALAGRMAAWLTHRGPDDRGEWSDERFGIGLGFRRLAIVDLSPTGHQPMVSASGRYVIVFNGEAYNFRIIREDLERRGHRFRGSSDTEVILAAVEEWGLRTAVERLVGMFAFALWDRNESRLHLVRDRLGIKPLYYGRLNNGFVFGSELKALAAHPEFQPEIDRGALALYMRHGYVPTPYSIHRGIAKLPPGTILTMRSPRDCSAPEPFWSARDIAEAGATNLFSGSETEAVDRLDHLLREAVSLRMIADVPLGAFLSGGIDSSTVVALMQAQSSQPVKTFTIGFLEDEYDEAGHAAAVAKHLGTDHTALVVTPAEAREVIPSLPETYDEPFADSSQIPTLLVSQLARRHVTVSLSGDGGDELFGGYGRYALGDRLWRRIRRIPPPVRVAGAHALTSLSPTTWDRTLVPLKPLIPSAARRRVSGDRLHKLAEILSAATNEELYQDLISLWRTPLSVVRGTAEPPTAVMDQARGAALPDFLRKMMFLDLISYLPDDILTKIDRASMAVSLEARVPLLDHRVVAFAATLPTSMLAQDGQAKWPLRQVLYRYVPRELIERPKMGFGVPIALWLRGPLREWAEDLLDEERLRSEGYFHPAPIRQKWQEHLSGRRNWQAQLWCVLQFQAWLRRWGDQNEAILTRPVSIPMPVDSAVQLAAPVGFARDGETLDVV
jgi:asparagine synthase (glutamine-hydrolysing)